MNIDLTAQEQNLSNTSNERGNDYYGGNLGSFEKQRNKGLKTNTSIGSNLGKASHKVSISAKNSTLNKRRFTSLAKTDRNFNEDIGAKNTSLKLNKQPPPYSGNSSIDINAFKNAYFASSSNTAGYKPKVCIF